MNFLTRCLCKIYKWSFQCQSFVTVRGKTENVCFLTQGGLQDRYIIPMFIVYVTSSIVTYKKRIKKDKEKSTVVSSVVLN